MNQPSLALHPSKGYIYEGVWAGSPNPNNADYPLPRIDSDSEKALGYPLTAVLAWEQMQARHTSIIQFSRDWTSDDGFLDINLLDAIGQHNSVPMISWRMKNGLEDTDNQNPASQVNYDIPTLLGGYFDSYIQEFALTCQEFGNQILLRPFHEFNAHNPSYRNWSPGIWIDAGNGWSESITEPCFPWTGKGA